LGSSADGKGKVEATAGDHLIRRRESQWEVGATAKDSTFPRSLFFLEKETPAIKGNKGEEPRMKTGVQGACGLNG